MNHRSPVLGSVWVETRKMTREMFCVLEVNQL